MDSSLTESEQELLAKVEQEWKATTSGTWYARSTDDDAAMIAHYVSTQPNLQTAEFIHDGSFGLAPGMPDQADPQQVVAITLHQSTGLALSPQSDANAVFIANAHQFVPQLLVIIRRLADALSNERKD
jgi:hypothetical protein